VLRFGPGIRCLLPYGTHAYAKSARDIVNHTITNHDAPSWLYVEQPGYLQKGRRVRLAVGKIGGIDYFVEQGYKPVSSKVRVMPFGGPPGIGE
jgi:hypothetical protein